MEGSCRYLSCARTAVHAAPIPRLSFPLPFHTRSLEECTFLPPRGRRLRRARTRMARSIARDCTRWRIYNYKADRAESASWRERARDRPAAGDRYNAPRRSTSRVRCVFFRVRWGKEEAGVPKKLLIKYISAEVSRIARFMLQGFRLSDAGRTRLRKLLKGCFCLIDFGINKISRFITVHTCKSIMKYIEYFTPAPAFALHSAVMNKLEVEFSDLFSEFVFRKGYLWRWEGLWENWIVRGNIKLCTMGSWLKSETWTEKLKKCSFWKGKSVHFIGTVTLLKFI